jgi:hypothetical protein
MGNCLVTKLKGVVDNDSLLKMGEMEFDFADKGTQGGSDVIAIATNIPGSTFRIVGNGYFTDETGVPDYGKTITTQDGIARFKSTGGGKIIIPHKYDNNLFAIVYPVNSFGIVTGDIDELAYSSNIYTYIEAPYVGMRGSVSKLTGKVKDHFSMEFYDDQTDMASFIQAFFDNSTAETLHLVLCCAMYPKLWEGVDLSLFAGKSNFSGFFRCDGAYGDIKYLADTLVGSIWIPDPNCKNFTGNIEDFVQRAISVGRTKPILFEGIQRYSNIYYNGTPLSQHQELFATSRLNWDAQGNITWTA